MNEISEQALRRLEALARVGAAITTLQARAALGVKGQFFHRMTQHDNFPTRTQIGREFYLNPAQLLGFSEHWNAMAFGLTILQVAKLIHCTLLTARRLSRQPGFPKPLGELNGRLRYSRESIVEWHSPRAGGAKLPANADASGSRHHRKMIGNGNGKGNKNGKGKTRQDA